MLESKLQIKVMHSKLGARNRRHTAIEAISSLQVLDSRGNPTVEATVYLSDGSTGRAAAPSGASTGSKEALELRDGGASYMGKGVLRACANIDGPIARALAGCDAADQDALDDKMLRLDGTAAKSKLGANAILAVSLAAAKAAAVSWRMPLYRYLGGTAARTLPVPLMNILNGGAHAANNVDIQEFMIVPTGARTFSEAVRWGTEVFHALKGLLAKRKMATAVGDEGGFAPDVDGVSQTLDLVMAAIKAAGRKPGKEIALALDCAANELAGKGTYALPGERAKPYTSAQFADQLAKWRTSYPIVSIEDGMAEDDWKGWQTLTAKLGATTQLVGDDLFVTSTKLLARGVKSGVANAILIKPNQCGSLTETDAAVAAAKQSGYGTVMSHRSGETEDETIADLAVGWDCGQIKTGAPSRGERTAKYNQLMRIESELGRAARYTSMPWQS